MESAGFIGEVARPRIPRPSLAARVAGGAGMLGAIVAFLAVSVGALFLGGFVTPFHYYDAMAIVAVAIGPALLVLAGPTLLSAGRGGPMKRLNAVCGLIVFLVLIPGNLVLYANQALDRSPAVEEIVPVREAWIRTGRHGGESFMAGVVTRTASPLGRRSFYGLQPVRLARAEWQRLVPGRSSLVLREHRGLFGFAWYEPEPPLAR